MAGKGGVGKTFIASTIARIAGRGGKFREVLAIDNDPSLNLGMALGIPQDKIGPPISEMADLIKDRTGKAPGEGGAFKMNPYVKDIPEKHAVHGPDNVRLLVLGTIKDPGSGCLCSGNALVRELLYHLVVQRDELVVLDFEAGIESSMGRATSKGLDVLLVVVEPGQKSLAVGEKIARMATTLGIKHVLAVVNKVDGEAQEAVLGRAVRERSMVLAGTIPRSDAVMAADLDGVPLLDVAPGDPAVLATARLLDEILRIAGA